LSDRSGRTWVGTYGSGLFLFDKSGPRQFPAEQTGGNNLVSLFEDSRSRVWMGGGAGAAVFDAGAFRAFGPEQGLPRGEVCYFAEDSAGAIWITNQHAVYRVDSNRAVEVLDEQGQRIAGIACLNADRGGAMWMGSLERGLLRFNQGQLEHLDARAGFPIAKVRALVEDDGWFWIASDRGLIRVQKRDLESALQRRAMHIEYQVLDQSDGLPSIEFTTRRQPTWARDSAGRIWFATSKGAASIQPAALSMNERAPEVRIEELVYHLPPAKVRGETSTGGEPADRVTLRPLNAEQPRIPAGGRRLELHFTALSLGAPHKVRFQVKLEGEDADWQDVGNQRVAYYHELAPRDYVFRVRATNDDGKWNLQGASLAFTVQPFFWQASWFRWCGAMFLVGCGAVLAWAVAHLRHQRSREKLELKQRRDELAHLSRVAMMGEMSGSLTHELNQPLTAILCNAEAARRFLSRKVVDLDELKGVLDQIVSDDRRASEIIGRLRPLLKRGEVKRELIDVNDVVREVLKVVEHELANKRVRVETSLEPGLPMISADRVQLQQVLINLIMNGCDAMADTDGAHRALVVSATPTNEDGLQISVTDHGVGISSDSIERVFEPFFTTKPDGMGLGLAVCRTIIKAHGGRLWATNNPQIGASFHVVLPVIESKIESA
jgi:signal transduction histidine kinase